MNNLNKFLLSYFINICYTLNLHNESDKRINGNFNSYFNLGDYSKIHLVDSLEFIDLVYPNNLEKLYFMKQYLKDFDSSCYSGYGKNRILVRK